MSTWRVGTKVPLNIYDGDRPVCQCHNEDDAAAIVEVFRKNARLRKALEAIADGEGEAQIIARQALEPTK